MPTLFLLLSAGILITAQPDGLPGRDTVVVCPKDFLPELQPWLTHRTGQGHRFAYVSNLHSADEIRRQVRQVAREGNLKAIVLIGDAPAPESLDGSLRGRLVPTAMVDFECQIAGFREGRYATDSWYADLDDDRLPDVAVGRWPVKNREQLATVVQKTLRYERQDASGVWRRQVNLVAGLGGFGPLIDGAVETATRRVLTDNLPASYATTVTYASRQSPYCPDWTAFRPTTLRRFNEGCLFWVYVGHGHVHQLDHILVGGQRQPILGLPDVDRLRAGAGCPIALFLSCLSASFAQPKDCLGESMLCSEGGPVAVIGGTEVTMPYGMAVLGTELMEQVFDHQRPSLGEVVLRAKQQMVAPEGRDETRTMLDTMAAALSPDPTRLSDELWEHVQMFQLLGDPLLRLPYPRPVTLVAPQRARAGETITVEGTASIAGTCVLELICRRDRLRTAETGIGQPTVSAAQAANQTYELSNDPCYASTSLVVPAGPFSTALEVPREAHGPCHVRAFVEGPPGGGRDFGLGAADVFIAQ